MAPGADNTFDYVVVGSGAGGGTVAVNLAAAGFNVLLCEAGSAYDSLNIDVPTFHGQSTEDPDIRWDFWVRHYSELDQQKKDSKYCGTYTYPGTTTPQVTDGVLYPRASTLGGCTAHNAMITVYPHNSDWEKIRRLTGDDSWGSDNMRRYFERLERCTYVRPDPSNAAQSRHGFAGWLSTSKTDPALGLGDPQLLEVIAAAAGRTFFELLKKRPGNVLAALKAFLENNPGLSGIFALLRNPTAAFAQAFVQVLDPSDYRVTLENREGVYFVPLAVNAGVRNGTRERILRVREAFAGNLTIWTDTLVTKLNFDGNRAVGVQYVSGRRLYEASIAPQGKRPEPVGSGAARASREVILAGGAFNTPQLLLLSGIGLRADLESLGIPLLLDRPAVGRYLQDRYEVAVISMMNREFSILEGCRFRLPDPAKGEEDDAALARCSRAFPGSSSSRRST